MLNGRSQTILNTKSLRTPFAKKRNQGHLSVTFADDSHFQGSTYLLRFDNDDATATLPFKLQHNRIYLSYK